MFELSGGVIVSVKVMDVGEEAVPPFEGDKEPVLARTRSRRAGRLCGEAEEVMSEWKKVREASSCKSTYRWG